MTLNREEKEKESNTIKVFLDQAQVLLRKEEKKLVKDMRRDADVS